MNIAAQIIRAKTDYDDVYSAGQSSMVDESKLIPKTVSGSYISVDDVSEIPHSVGCKVESVNLLNPDNLGSGEIVEYNGVPCYKYTDKNADTGIWAIKGCFKENTQYSYSIKQYREDGAVLTRTIIHVEYTDGTIVQASLTESGYVSKFTTEEGKTVKRIFSAAYAYLPAYLDLSVSCLHEGTTALPYTPYVKPEEVKVTRCEENWVTFSKAWTGVSRGITATVNEDGSIVVNGTATSLRQLMSNPIPWYADEDIYCTISFGEKQTGIQASLQLVDASGKTITTDYAVGTKNVLIPRTCREIIMNLYVTSGTTVENYTFFPMLNIGTTAPPYEPYNGQTLTPNTDGTVEGMTSVSPYMNIFSDTEGVNIEATYNKSWGMQTEYDRRWDRIQDYGNKTTYAGFFAGSSWNENSLNPKYVAKPTGNEAYQMFMFCNRGGKTKIDYRTIKEKIDLSGVVNAPNLFQDAGIDYIDLDLPNCVNLSNGFSEGWSAGKKTTISIYITEKCTSLTGCFSYCTALANLTFKEGSVIAVNINLQYSPLIKESITSVINALSSTATGQTLTLKLSAVNTAFETSAGAKDGSTSAEFAALVATKTNWTITMI